MQIRSWINNLILITLFAVGVIVTSLQQLTFGQEITPTPFTSTPTLTDSLFVDDTCSPPCWFGLTPGVSTAFDVQHILQNAEHIFEFHADEDSEFDATSGLIVNGFYRFNLLPPSEFTEIRDGILWRFRVAPNHRIDLTQTLQVLGPPDEVRLFLGPYGNMALNLIYFYRYLRVHLEALPHCNTASIHTEFNVLYIEYYSPEAAVEPLERRDDLPPQPALISYPVYYDGERLSERHVPRNVWNSWLTGRVNISCDGAWTQLSNEMILPDWPPDDSEAEE